MPPEALWKFRWQVCRSFLPVDSGGWSCQFFFLTSVVVPVEQTSSQKKSTFQCDGHMKQRCSVIHEKLHNLIYDYLYRKCGPTLIGKKLCRNNSGLPLWVLMAKLPRLRFRSTFPPEPKHSGELRMTDVEADCQHSRKLTDLLTVLSSCSRIWITKHGILADCQYRIGCMCRDW